MASPLEADHWRRTQLLSLLDAAAHAGLTPIDQTLLHRSAFLSNALAPIYKLDIEHGLVTRWKRGPFFPELQWDLDRLAAMGLAHFDRIKHLRDDEGVWFEVRYSLGPRAREFLEAARVVPSFRRLQGFHRELLAAIASMPDSDRSDAALADANYSNTVDASPEESETVIDFGQWTSRNFAVRASEAVDRELKGLPRLEARARLHLYLRYLAGQTSRQRREA